MSSQLPLTPQSPITIGLVITLVLAAISWGVILQKVDDVREDVEAVKESIIVLDKKIDEFISKDRTTAMSKER